MCIKKVHETLAWFMVLLVPGNRLMPSHHIFACSGSLSGFPNFSNWEPAKENLGQQIFSFAFSIKIWISKMVCKKVGCYCKHFLKMFFFTFLKFLDLVGLTAYWYIVFQYIILMYFPIESKYDIRFLEKSIIKKIFNFQK